MRHETHLEKRKNSKAFGTAIRTVFGLAARILQFDIAATSGQCWLVLGVIFLGIQQLAAVLHSAGVKQGSRGEGFPALVRFLGLHVLSLRSQSPFTGDSVLRGPGRKVPPGLLFECVWAPLFGGFGAKKRQKALEKHSLGHSGPGAQTHSKSKLRGGTFRPGPLSTPVNDGWDHMFF